MRKAVRNNLFSKMSVFTGILTVLTFFFAFVLASTSISASSFNDNVKVKINESCVLTTSSGGGETYTLSMQNGQYNNNVGKTNFSVSCNHNQGFGVYAVGYSGDTYGNNEMITTSTGATNIATGTATTGDTSAWAMKIGLGSSGSDTPTIINPFNDFAAVPDTYTKVASVDSPLGNTVSATLTSQYAVYISPTQGAGTYTGKVKYTVVFPSSNAPTSPQAATKRKISYFPNAAGVADTMGDHAPIDMTQFDDDCYDAGGHLEDGVDGKVCVDDNSGDTIDIPTNLSSHTYLWPSNFKRPRYAFVGWSDAYDYVANVGSSSNPSAKIYGPSERIAVPANLETDGLSLYAVWVKSEGELQNWNGCSGLGIGQVTALTDIRDNDTYAVAKLASGQCWIIENLRLGGTAPITLTPADTDIATNFVLSASEDAANWPYNSHDISVVDLTIVNAENKITAPSNMKTSEEMVYSYGNYYNYYTATAGTKDYNAGGGDAPGSICPKGWGIPVGLAKNDYKALVDTIEPSGEYATKAAEATLSYPNNFLLSGSISIGSIDGNGYDSSFWAMTASGSSTALYYGSFIYVYNDLGSVKTGNHYDNKFRGLSVRCVVKN